MPGETDRLLSAERRSAWAEINRAEADQERASNRAMTPGERLTVGQELSRQAFSLLSASVKAGHAPGKALWS